MQTNLLKNLTRPNRSSSPFFFRSHDYREELPPRPRTPDISLKKVASPPYWTIGTLEDLAFNHCSKKLGDIITTTYNRFCPIQQFVEYGSGLGRLFDLAPQLKAKCTLVTDIDPKLLKQNFSINHIRPLQTSIQDIGKSMRPCPALVGLNVLDTIESNYELFRCCQSLNQALVPNGILFHFMDMNPSLDSANDLVKKYPGKVLIRIRHGWSFDFTLLLVNEEEFNTQKLFFEQNLRLRPAFVPKIFDAQFQEHQNPSAICALFSRPQVINLNEYANQRILSNLIKNSFRIILLESHLDGPERLQIIVAQKN